MTWMTCQLVWHRNWQLITNPTYGIIIASHVRAKLLSLDERLWQTYHFSLSRVTPDHDHRPLGVRREELLQSDNVREVTRGLILQPPEEEFHSLGCGSTLT